MSSAERAFVARSEPPEGSESTELRDRLEKAKKSILEEIRNYPAPDRWLRSEFQLLD
jgi:hypothetical protein